MDFKNPFVIILFLVIALPLNAQQSRPRFNVPLEDLRISVDINAARNFDSRQIPTQRIESIEEFLRNRPTHQVSSEAFISELRRNREIDIGFFLFPPLSFFNQYVHLFLYQNIAELRLYVML